MVESCHCNVNRWQDQLKTSVDRKGDLFEVEQHDYYYLFNIPRTLLFIVKYVLWWFCIAWHVVCSARDLPATGAMRVDRGSIDQDSGGPGAQCGRRTVTGSPTSG